MAQDRKDMDALAGALQRVTVDGGEVELAGMEESLSASERSVVLKLKELQEQHAALSSVFEAAVLRLKMEYEEKYRPLYQKRLEALIPANAEDQTPDKQTTGTPGLPSFWLRALKANRLLADMIEEHDEAPLGYLRNIECEWLSPAAAAAAAAAAGAGAAAGGGGSAADSGGAGAAPHPSPSSSSSSPPPAAAAAAAAGGGGGEEGAAAAGAAESLHPESFRLVFTFSENPFFKPLTLIKEYRLSVSPGGRGAELTSTHSTRIEWFRDKDVTKKTVIRKQRNRKTKQTRTVAETVDANSFFNLFVDHEIPSDDKLEKMEEKEVEELQMVVEADYDIGITIRDKIIPRAVDWFLGQVDDDSDFEDYEMNEEEFDSEESDEDEDSSEDEPPREHKGHHRH